MEARRIRILFSDPDATDSDSNEDACSDSGHKTKIVILHCNGSDRSSALAAAASCRKRVAGSATVKPHRGVYERQPGRWVAEFRSQRLNVRRWVGTFATEEEARAAYDAFEKDFLSSRCSGLPLPVSERGGRAAGVHRASNPHSHPNPHPSDEKRQIVQALTATGMMPSLPPSACASAPCTSCSTSASAPPPPLVPPTPFQNMQTHADAPPSVNSFWADEPAYEDLVGLADLAHLPLPFSDGSMDFDPADLSLFDDGFL